MKISGLFAVQRAVGLDPLRTSGTPDVEKPQQVAGASSVSVPVCSPRVGGRRFVRQPGAFAHSLVLLCTRCVLRASSRSTFIHIPIRAAQHTHTAPGCGLVCTAQSIILKAVLVVCSPRWELWAETETSGSVCHEPVQEVRRVDGDEDAAELTGTDEASPRHTHTPDTHTGTRSVDATGLSGEAKVGEMERAARIVVLSVIFLSSQINCQEAILHVSNGITDKEYCIVHNHSWTPLSQTLEDALRYPLVNMISTMLCNSSGITPDVVNGKALVVMRGDCNFSQKVLVAQSLGATTLLIASNTTLSTPSANDSAYATIHIPLALMRYRDILDAQQLFGEEMQVQLYAPPYSKLDPSIAVMLLISIVTVALGGFWSGACERDRLNSGLAGGGGGESKADSGELFLYSPLKVVFFVALMCGMLVLMYFFYNILVYVIIAIFCLASASALFSCLDAVMELIGCATGSFSVRNCNLSVRSLILAAVCITIAVVWGVYRNEDRWIWILQDLLGIAFCLNFMKTISLSNFKICVILLSLLLVYDVFFVFITPFFTKNGVSIMVQVALGPDASGEKTQGNMVEVPAEPQTPSEKLPVVMRVPRFSAWAQNLCGMQFSILGYGDIIVPGLLVAYCSRFDVWINSSKKIYFVSCCIAYLLGMIVTFAVMLLSGMGQPALLYLVPFTLITSAVVAGCRGEMRQFWAGTTYEREELTAP